jgi:hypothetical protein
VNGRWDFVCLLLGISGFLLILGPVLLTVVDSTWRAIWVTGQFHRARTVLEKEVLLWSAMGGFYLLFMFLFMFQLLRSRSFNSVIYGMPSNRFEELLTTTLERLGHPWSSVGNYFQIRSNRDPQEFTELEVEPFPSMGIVTLHWDEIRSPLRSEVETELEKTFDRMTTPPSPVSGWFFTASVTLFFVLLVWMAFLIVFMWTAGR